MKMAKNDVETAIKQKRLIFLNDGKIEYTDKTGVTKTYTLDELASVFWTIWDSYLLKMAGVNLATYGIEMSNVKQIIIDGKGVKVK